ncbi:hypothetical protein CBA19CS91_10840 [Paraburkholderia hospita]|nr:hypothetical protein CBA19CS91_10840 [Paraburkholderia hospita]
MDESTLVQLPQYRCYPDSVVKKVLDFHGRAEQSREGLATGVFEHQHGLAVFTYKFEWPHCPSSVQFVFQAELMCEPIKAGWPRMFGGRAGEQDIGTVDVARSPSAPEDALAIVPRHLESVVHCSEP